jgi:8-oxo-dGTP diphosphatase
VERPVVVVAGIIRKDDFLLIAQRKDDANEAGKWEFPGGKIEYGERPEDSLKREIKEELGIDIEVGEFFTMNSHIYNFRGKNIHIILLAYFAVWVSGEVELIDCKDAKWIQKKELKNYEFAAADIPFVEKLS